MAQGLLGGVVLGQAVVGLVAFLLLGLVRRRLTGAETIVQLEALLLVLAVQAGLLRGAGLPVLAYLDPVATGLALQLAFGRLGCQAAGCCRGPVTDLALGRRRRSEARRFPTPAVEATLWLALSLGAAALDLVAAPGRALAVVLMGGGLTRLMLAPLRADAGRTFLGIRYDLALATLTLALGLALELASAALVARLVGAAGLAGIATLIATRRWWLALPPVLDAQALDALAALGAEARFAGTAPTRHQVAEWTVAFSRGAEGLVVSASAPGPRSEAEARVVLDALLAGARAGPVGVVERRPSGIYIATVALEPALAPGGPAT